MVVRKALHALAAIGIALSPGCGSVGTPSQEQAPVAVTHDELKALFSRPRTIDIVAGNLKAVGVYSPSGAAQLDWGTGGARGTWRINGDQFCTKYPGIRRGYENCFSVRQAGPNAYTTHEPDGSRGSTWQVRP